MYIVIWLIQEYLHNETYFVLNPKFMYLKIDYEKLRHLIIENSRRTNLALWLYKYYEKKRVIRRFFHCLMTYCFRLVSYLVQLGHV